MPRWASFLILLALASCGKSEPAEPASLRDAVAVGAPPLAAWASLLLHETPIEVEPLYADEGPTGSTTPPRARLAAARTAKLVVLFGPSFEKWARQAALPSTRTVQLGEGLRDRLLEVEERTHAHGAQGEHTHKGVDGRSWLDPALAREQARRLATELCARFPEHAASITLQAAELEQRLSQLEAALADHREALAAETVLVQHGHGLAYLARIWGGPTQELELDLDQKLGTSDWNRVRAAITGAGGLLLLSDEPAAALRAQLETELKLQLVVIPTGEGAIDPAAVEGLRFGAWWQRQAGLTQALPDAVEALLASRAGE
ncbi:MAG: hypothetical protein CMJ94_13095 [Planctomycetes bacterium]|nr:hypothetical protein [Planctomycetota bacterium]